MFEKVTSAVRMSADDIRVAATAALVIAMIAAISLEIDLSFGANSYFEAVGSFLSA